MPYKRSRWGAKKAPTADAAGHEASSPGAAQGGADCRTQDAALPGHQGARIGVVWHKCSDLRLFDHEPVYHAHRENDFVLHVHIVEEAILVGKSRELALPRCAPVRCQFWRESVRDLAERLRNRSVTGGKGGAKQGLLVLRAKDAVKCLEEQVIQPLLKEQPPRITLYAHQELCSEEQEVEASVGAMIKKVAKDNATNVAFRTYWGAQTVHHIDDLERKCGFNADFFPETKGEYNKAAKRCAIREVLPEPGTWRRSPSIPNLVMHSVEELEDIFGRFYREEVAAERFWEKTKSNAHSSSSSRGSMTAVPESHESAEQPYSRVSGSFRHRWKGGETMALEHASDFFDDSPEKLWQYRGATESFAHGSADENPVLSGSRFSPWLAFGCISARYLVKKAYECERKFGKGKSGGRERSGKGGGKTGSTGSRLHTELLFRDFLRLATFYSWGKRLFYQTGPFRLKRDDIAWRSSDDASATTLFTRWRLGQTGFPFVDAGMRELLNTGYLSHLHRQCCASFLVRDLQLDWRWGAEWFEAALLDYTPDANWGNWSYRILPRPCLVKNRKAFLAGPLAGTDTTGGASNSTGGKKGSGKKGKTGSGSTLEFFPVSRVMDTIVGDAKVLSLPHISTLECLVWPVVHDPRFEHTLFWCPELRKLVEDKECGSYDLAREPWRADSIGNAATSERISIKPFRDSPLWFCAANRSNWDYEYFWLPGKAWTVKQATGGKGADSVQNVRNTEYPRPIVPPLNVEIDLSRLPVRDFVWGDSRASQRPHVW